MMPQSSGIYAITHLDSGRGYIGSSIRINRRLRIHKSNLNSGRHCNPYLQHAWEKHGESKFILSPILICSPENLLFYEQLLIDGYKTCKKEYGFNLKPIAQGRFGYKEAIATRVKRLAKKYGLMVDPNNPERVYSPPKSIDRKQIKTQKKILRTRRRNINKKILYNAKIKGLI